MIYRSFGRGRLLGNIWDCRSAAGGQDARKFTAKCGHPWQQSTAKSVTSTRCPELLSEVQATVAKPGHPPRRRLDTHRDSPQRSPEIHGEVRESLATFRKPWRSPGTHCEVWMSRRSSGIPLRQSTTTSGNPQRSLGDPSRIPEVHGDDPWWTRFGQHRTEIGRIRLRGALGP